MEFSLLVSFKSSNMAFPSHRDSTSHYSIPLQGIGPTILRDAVFGCGYELSRAALMRAFISAQDNHDISAFMNNNEVMAFSANMTGYVLRYHLSFALYECVRVPSRPLIVLLNGYCLNGYCFVV